MKEDPPGSRAQSARSARLVALLVGLPIFALLLAFMVMPFLARDETRLNAVGPIPASPGLERGGVRFAGTVHLWEIDGRIGTDDQQRLRLAFDLRGPDGQPSPPGLEVGLTLDMPEREMVPLRLSTTRTGPGAYSASGSIPEEGRWRLRMEFPEVTGVLLFEAGG